MPRWVVPVLVGVGIGMIVMFAIQIGRPTRDGGGAAGGDRAALGRELPPSAAELERRFRPHWEVFETVRDILLAAPHQPFSMQVDYLWWKQWEGWTGWTANDGRWWSSDREGGIGEWKETDEVLREAGLDIEDFRFVRSFLHAEGLLSVHRVSDGAERDPVILFRPPHPLVARAVERSIAWHADPEPTTSESVYVYSETRRLPQRTTETSLGVPGWFIRTITRKGWP